MTHEILIAESRKELEWLDRKDQYHQMLFDYATRKYPACLLLMDALARKDWVTANHLVTSILTHLIATQIIDAKSKTLEMFLPSINNDQIIDNQYSTIRCMSSINGILFNCYYGTYAVIDITPFKPKSFFGAFSRKKASSAKSVGEIES